MDYFNKITNFNEAKLIYRRLARLNHPDIGGNPEVMKKINIEFEQLKKHLCAQNNDFTHLKIGDWVIINGSKSIVTSISQNTFTAKSEYTKRQAVFSIETGICLNNPKFKVEKKKSLSNVS